MEWELHTPLKKNFNSIFIVRKFKKVNHVQILKRINSCIEKNEFKGQKHMKWPLFKKNYNLHTF